MSYQQRANPPEAFGKLPPMSVASVTCCLCGHPVAGVPPHRHNHNWTAEQDAFIQRAASRGVSVKAIAYTLSTEAATVANRLQALRKLGR